MLTRHRGAYIRALSRSEADEALVVLEVLTGLMARLAAETVNAGDHAERIRKAYSGSRLQGRTAHQQRVHREARHFYDTLAEIGGNEHSGGSCRRCRSICCGCRSSRI